MAADNRTPVDIWLKFETPVDEEPSFEGNTFPTEDGRYCLEWYHTAVGQVSRKWVDTYADAVRFWESNGFQDFSS